METPDNQQLKRPDLFITLASGRQIKMSYGLEMDIRRMLPDPLTAMQLAISDPLSQDYVVRRCLTEAKHMILKQEDLTEDVDDLTPEDTERLLIWAVEHVLFFFAKQTSALAALGAKFPTAQPNPSTDGSENSASMTPSAGPSE